MMSWNTWLGSYTQTIVCRVLYMPTVAMDKWMLILSVTMSGNIKTGQIESLQDISTNMLKPLTGNCPWPFNIESYR